MRAYSDSTQVQAVGIPAGLHRDVRLGFAQRMLITGYPEKLEILIRDFEKATS